MMSEFTIDELLAQFDEAVQPKVLAALESVQGLAVYRLDDKVKALALTPEPEPMLDDGFTLIGIYRKTLVEGNLSRTQQALNYMKENGVTSYAAAVHFNLDPTTVYKAVKRSERKRCPCCNQTIKQHS